MHHIIVKLKMQPMVSKFPVFLVFDLFLVVFMLSFDFYLVRAILRFVLFLATIALTS
jgi:hypothetical protein